MKRVFILSILLLAFSLNLKAQTLDDYLITAGENNPLLKARYAEYEAALQRVPQVGALPDPQANFNFFLQPMERFMGNQVGEASVMQMFPWVGSLGAAKDEARYMARMRLAAFNEAKINLHHDVFTSWVNLYRIDKEAELLEKELELLKALERIALAKYKSAPVSSPTGASRQGTMPASGTSMSSATQSGSNSSGMAGMGGTATGSAPANRQNNSMSGGNNMSSGMATSGTSMVDVILIRVQVKDLENRLQLLRDSRKPQEVAFNNLLNRQPDAAIQVADTLLPAELPASLSLIQDSIRQNHPMLKMYEWDEKAREAQYRMARLMGRPMIGLGVNYMVFKPRTDEATQMTMGGENMVMPMVSVTLPIYRGKYNAAKREAQFAQKAAVYQKEAAERQLFTELENLLYTYQRTTTTLALLEDQIKLNEQAIRLLTTNYSVAGGGIEDILRQRQSILTYRQQQLQAITDQQTAVHDISRLMNTQIYTVSHDTSK
ncbi:outer membrane protein TolC [Pontibacter aydingkolensis]|uniref:TolC family protein n=1 Tax=Pontibacter aydingkolensis TaxID=1911536 RepID=A0ABS7CS51_9BACT|nr:TolC family protein [Pontibacter aydingkolensis]MBW7466674.1 TolC family protein [Pontibacter aydingkolensis]